MRDAPVGRWSEIRQKGLEPARTRRSPRPTPRGMAPGSIPPSGAPRRGGGAWGSPALGPRRGGRRAAGWPCREGPGSTAVGGTGWAGRLGGPFSAEQTLIGSGFGGAAPRGVSVGITPARCGSGSWSRRRLYRLLGLRDDSFGTLEPPRLPPSMSRTVHAPERPQGLRGGARQSGWGVRGGVAVAGSLWRDSPAFLRPGLSGTGRGLRRGSRAGAGRRAIPEASAFLLPSRVGG